MTTTETAHILLDDAGVAWIDERFDEVRPMASQQNDTPMRKRVRQ